MGVTVADRESEERGTQNRVRRRRKKNRSDRTHTLPYVPPTTKKDCRKRKGTQPRRSGRRARERLTPMTMMAMLLVTRSEVFHVLVTGLRKRAQLSYKYMNLCGARTRAQANQ